MARYVNKQEGIQNSSLGKSAPGLHPCGRFPHLLWQHSFLRDKQSPRGEGADRGACQHTHTELPVYSISGNKTDHRSQHSDCFHSKLAQLGP